MRRLHVKQMFRTWMKALLHCGYKYLLNVLVTLVTYISYLLFLVKSLSFEL